MQSYALTKFRTDPPQPPLDREGKRPIYSNLKYTVLAEVELIFCFSRLV